MHLDDCFARKRHDGIAALQAGERDRIDDAQRVLALEAAHGERNAEPLGQPPRGDETVFRAAQNHVLRSHARDRERPGPAAGRIIEHLRLVDHGDINCAREIDHLDRRAHVVRAGVDHALFARHERRRYAELAQPLVDLERQQPQRCEIRAALGREQMLERGVGFAGVRRPGVILEGPHLAREAFDVESQAEIGLNTLVDAPIFELFVGVDEAAPRVLERRKERTAIEHMARRDVVRRGEHLRRRARHGMGELAQRRRDDRFDRRIAGRGRQLGRHRNRDAAAHHDRPRTKRERALDFDLDRFPADQFPAQPVDGLTQARAFRFPLGALLVGRISRVQRFREVVGIEWNFHSVDAPRSRPNGPSPPHQQAFALSASVNVRRPAGR